MIVSFKSLSIRPSFTEYSLPLPPCSKRFAFCSFGTLSSGIFSGLSAHNRILLFGDTEMELSETVLCELKLDWRIERVLSIGLVVHKLAPLAKVMDV